MFSTFDFGNSSICGYWPFRASVMGWVKASFNGTV